MTTLTEVSDYFKANMDFARFARLTKALGKQANTNQLRFIKAVIFEKAIESYSENKIVYVGNTQEGCDLEIPELGNTRVEMKYVENALYSGKKKKTRPTTGAIKLMNSLGTNTHATLPDTYADYLLFVGSSGAMLFDKPTVTQHISSGGDGISCDIPVNLGILLADPAVMNAGPQEEVDFMGRLQAFITDYINSVL